MYTFIKRESISIKTNVNTIPIYISKQNNRAAYAHLQDVKIKAVDYVEI